MKISLTPIPYCIMLLFSHFLHSGFEMTNPHSIPTDLHTQVRLLLCDVQEGRKEKADLNKRIILHCMYKSIPVIGLAKEVDEESLHLMRQMLEAGADPNITTGCYESALEFALKYGSSRGVRLLLEHGADAIGNSHMLKELACTMEWSRAYESEEYRKEIMENVQLLLHHGADINMAYYRSFRPAFYDVIASYTQFPSRGKHRDCVLMLIKLFLRNGANPYITKVRFFIDDILRERTVQNVIEYTRENKLPEWARFIVQGRRGYWAARVLFNGTKEDESLCYGPFPPEITDLIMQYFWDDLCPKT